MKKKEDLRIVFMGTPEFAVTILDKIITDGYQVVGCVTVPDKPAGRGQKIHKSAVKQYANEKNLYTLQPEKLKSPEFIAALEELRADVFSYGIRRSAIQLYERRVIVTAAGGSAAGGT